MEKFDFSKTVKDESNILENETWILYKNISNMIEYYRNELIKFMKDKFEITSIPAGTRKRLVEYGIISKFGTKFFLTEVGKDLLKLNGT